MERKKGFKKNRKKRFKLKKKKPVLKQKGFWRAFFCCSFLGILFYFFVFSEFFQVKEIEVFGNAKSSSDELREIVFTEIETKLLFSTKTIWLAKLNKTESKILQEFPQIQSVELKWKLPDKLILEIKERMSVVVFCQDSGSCFKVDDQGVAFEYAQEENALVVYFQKSDIFLGEKIIDENDLKSILEIQRAFKQEIELEITRLSLRDKELIVKTSYGFEIYFDLNADIESQLFNLTLALKEKISLEQREVLEYIDLRFGNKVYFK